MEFQDFKIKNFAADIFPQGQLSLTQALTL